MNKWFVVGNFTLNLLWVTAFLFVLGVVIFWGLSKKEDAAAKFSPMLPVIAHYTTVDIDFRSTTFCDVAKLNEADAIKITFNGRQVLRFPFLDGPAEIEGGVISPETLTLIAPWAQMWQAIAKDFCRSQEKEK